MRIIFLRTNAVNPDPRVEKEVNSLLRNKELYVKILAWDRDANYQYKTERLNLVNGQVDIIRFGVKASWGGGMKKNFVSAIKARRQMIRWLKNNRHTYDCIHACDLFTGYPALKISKRFNKKLVYDIYDYYPDCHVMPNFLRNIFVKMETKVINNADCTIICSEERKKQIGNCNPKKLEIIHNSPEEIVLDENISICRSNCDKIKIVYVGNLVQERYIMQLLDIVSNMNDVELHIGGIGVLAEEVESYANRFENIYYYGKLKYIEVLSLEKVCDIMVALYDPFIKNHKYAAPNKLYEAMYLGKPLIVFKDTGMDKIITDNNVGVAVEANVESIKNGIQELINVKNNNQQLSQCMNLLYDQFKWEIMEKRLLKIYKDLK